MMQKWNLLVKGNDGRKFYQNFHVLQETPEKAKSWLLLNFPDKTVRASIQITEIENIEEADLLLPGIVYESGKAYFD